jgi:hypothetical protein
MSIVGQLFRDSCDCTASTEMTMVVEGGDWNYLKLYPRRNRGNRPRGRIMQDIYSNGGTTICRTTVLSISVASNEHTDPWWPSTCVSIPLINENLTPINSSHSDDTNISEKQHNQFRFLQLFESTVVIQKPTTPQEQESPHPRWTQNIHYNTHIINVTGACREPYEKKSTVLNHNSKFVFTAPSLYAQITRTDYLFCSDFPIKLISFLRSPFALRVTPARPSK